MDVKSILEDIKKISSDYGIDPDLALAISGEESGYIPGRCRYEPNWNYLYHPEKYAKLLLITERTEIEFQKFSYGIFQVMGSVLRECGYNSHLPLSLDVKININYGCKKISLLKEIYKNEMDLISAYNQGSNLKIKGLYKNQSYVDKVSKRLSRLRFI